MPLISKTPLTHDFGACVGKSVPTTGGAKAVAGWLWQLLLARDIEFYGYDKATKVSSVAVTPEENAWRKGEPLDRLAEVEVVSVGVEVLMSITKNEVRREGFPDWSPVDFVSFFCDSMHVTRFVEVTRIEWRYL